MTKTIQTLLAVSLFLLLIGLIYYQGQKYGSNSEINKQQEQQNIIKDDIIKTKEFQQKLLRKNNNNNISTNRIKWLLFAWQKRSDSQR